MNPPAALHSAMARERKPFSYLPGGLDLSQIKSEKMAMRLMRNAMNPGVSEVAQSLPSPTTPTTPIAVPNFNCLPVQVFPSFVLPANPQSLLRARNHPHQPKGPPPERVNKPSQINKTIEKKDAPLPTFHEAKVETNNNIYIPNNNMGSSRPTSVYTPIPEDEETHLFNIDTVTPNISDIKVIRESSLPPELKPTLMPSALCANLKNRSRSSSVNRDIKTSRSPELDSNYQDYCEFDKKSIYPDGTKTNKDCDEFKQSEYQITEKQTTTKKKTEEITTTQTTENDEDSADAELTVTLPSKKATPKIETKVEVQKKKLPNGDVQEITITTTKTTLDGKTQIKTQIDTKTFPKDEYEEVEEEIEEEEEEDGVQIEEVKENESGDDCAVTKDDGNIKNVKETTETITVKKVMFQEESDQCDENSQNHNDEEIETQETQETTISNIKQTENISQVDNHEIVNKTQISDEQEEKEKVHKEEVVEPEEEFEETIEENLTSSTAIQDSNTVEIELNASINEKQTTESKTITTLKETTATETQKVENNDEEDEEEEYEEVEEIEEEEEVEDEKYEEAEVDEATEKVEPVKEVVEPAKEVVEPTKVVEPVTEVEPAKEQTEVIQTTAQQQSSQDIRPTSQSFEIHANVEESTKEVKLTHTKTESVSNSNNFFENLSFAPPIKLDQVEDVEIKPIGSLQDSHKHIISDRTEIITDKTPVTGPLSTQTELNRVENVVIQNRITQKLDRNYENFTQQGIPTAKSYYAPPQESVPLLSPQPAKTYEPYIQEDKNENRHSLLFERLSLERHIPSLIKSQDYQIINDQQNVDTQNQSTEEPRVEILTVSNVKPSSVTKNQHWYQQSKNVVSNDVSTTEINRDYSRQSMPRQIKPEVPLSQPQPEYQSQPQYQPPPPEYYPKQQYQPPPQRQPEPEPQYQYQTQPEPQYHYQPQPTYQNISQPLYQNVPHQVNATQPSYLSQNSSYNNNYNSNNFSSTDSYQQTYSSLNNVPKQPSSQWESNVSNSQLNSNVQTNQYSNQSYEKENQNYSATYVPPPWEQESSYVSDYSTQTSYQQTLPPLNSDPLPSWQPPPPNTKPSKPARTAYIPPAPNQSFVKPISKADIKPKAGGRKTYYSEYERRYISVPETTYLPSETRVQPQPEPSPQYYYDNDEPIEKEEPSWRKELREFSEKKSFPQYEPEQNSVNPPWKTEEVYNKSSTVSYTSNGPEQTSVNPPWKTEEVYNKSSTASYTSTPTWSQTLKPRSNRDRSFQADYVTAEWPKTNTVSRGRPLSTHMPNSFSHRPERSRGVSVDRYNPNSYHSPIPTEHPPVQSHTLTPATAPQHKIHNRQNRASAEPRELPAHHPRMWGDSRSSPIQSRSFKYLQWITGTDE